MKNTVSAFLAISGLSFVTALVAESSLEPRIVPPPDEACKTYASGYLAANITGNWKSFTVNSKNQISYVGDGKNALFVEFQSCPLWQDAGPGAADEQIGIVYVPSHQKCIAVLNPQQAAGPYWTILRDCYYQQSGTPYNLKWDLRTVQDNELYWLGGTDEEGTEPQGGCGLLTYDIVGDTPVPWATNDQWKQIRISCPHSDAGFYNNAFRLAKAPH